MDGDEFAVLFRGGGKNAVLEFYAALKESFERQQESDGKNFSVRCRQAVRFCPRDGASYLDLVKHAHYSLEYAKAAGKNRLLFFSEEILQSKKACSGNDGRAALLCGKWHAGVFGLLPASGDCGNRRFLRRGGAAALEFGKVRFCASFRIYPAAGGKWVDPPCGALGFTQAAAACAQWEAYRKGSPISVNVSYLQLEREDFLDFLTGTLQKTGASPEHMVLEFTESCIAYNLDALSESFRSIRKLGIKIAMDDFGTGYSSLGILETVSRGYCQDRQGLCTGHPEQLLRQYLYPLYCGALP